MTHCRCDGTFNDNFITNFQETVNVKKMKIGQYLMKLCLKYYWFFFSGHGVESSRAGACTKFEHATTMQLAPTTLQVMHMRS